MTDKPNEWRDDEGRLIRPHSVAGSDFYFAGELEVIAITKADARFLLRYLPEALGEKRFVSGKQVYERYIPGYSEEDDRCESVPPEVIAALDAADEDDLSDAQAGSLAKTVDNAELKRMVELGAEVIAAAENFMDHPHSGGAWYRLHDAVRAKRAAMEQP